VHRYRDLLDEVTKTMSEIHKDFLSPGGQGQINIAESLLLQTRKDMKKTITEKLPGLENIFDDCSTEIERLVATDIYPRFVRHQMVVSASKALATDRSKYAGLGDCFVLTNPAKADNPIVYASDGFVKVTGYPRNEIIPRNCRFLQGRQTDRRAVKRLRKSIDNGQESVELLLNHKKTGEPFWNLLYVTPLYDFEGRLAFFLGGQINCSTTIHNASDILRILAYSEDEDEDLHPHNPVIPPPKPGSSLLRKFRLQKPAGPPRAPGMETGLLDRLERLNLGSQMTEFYTAYSKFIVVNVATNFISFHSYGIIALLYPVKPAKNSSGIPGVFPENVNVVQPRRNIGLPQQQQQQQMQTNAAVHSVAGQDIFKFLAQHTQNSLSRDFKATVKNAMRMGSAVSLDLTLCTRRRMGFERFVTHWTPVKDEGGRTEFMVLTLGGLEH
jgi:PAS domain-containing protein